MTPPPKRQFVKLQLPLTPNGDEELMCVLCSQRECEYAIELSGSGRKVQVGIHEQCATRYAIEGAVK